MLNKETRVRTRGRNTKKLSSSGYWAANSLYGWRRSRNCSNKEGLAITRKERGKDYHPYYAVGDFNHDRNEDFAVAFVNDRKRRNKFSMAIFNGPFTPTSVPAYFVDNSDLSMVGFSWQQGEQNYLLQGEFQSDFCWIFKPRGKTYRLEDCLED